MLCIFLTDDALSSKVPQLTLRIAEGDCIVKSQFVNRVIHLTSTSSVAAATASPQGEAKEEPVEKPSP